MSDMNNGSWWVDPELDDEFFSGKKAFLEMVSIDDTRDSLGEEVMYSSILYHI